MIKLLLFDLGDTLIRGREPLPHVIEALTAISQFTTLSGEKLLLGILSDFGDPTDSESKLAALEREFADILRGAAGLDRFFVPFEARVTISARAGAFKPDPRTFQTAVKRSGIDANLSECLFITENPSHLKAARDLGLEILGFGDGLTDVPSFTDWLEAPLLIAEIVAPENMRNRERAISAALKEDRDIGTFKCLSQRGNRFQGQASQLVRLDHPELGYLSGAFVEIPVDVAVQCNARGAIDEVVVNEATNEDVDNAISYVQQLVRRGKISDQPETSTRGATHAVETDEEGRKIIVRQRFSQ